MPLPARLLAKEEIDILDGTCQPRARVVTRHDIAHDVTALLTRGLTTTSAGGFFFIPYLLQLGAHDLAATLGPPKHEGLPKERLALGLVFESIFGYTAGIRAVDTVSRADFGLLAGLPFLPAPPPSTGSCSLSPSRAPWSSRPHWANAWSPSATSRLVIPSTSMPTT